MIEPFEPLHQPPPEAGMRDHPPESPACARVRGLMRDYADHDLAQDLHLEVEVHVHDCRTCALELGRAEFEVDRLRRAFASRWIPVGPRPGFARRASEALRRDGADEPTAVPIARTGAKVRRKQASGSRSDRSDRRSRPARRVVREPWLAAAAVAAFVCMLLVGWAWQGAAEFGNAVNLTCVRADLVFRLNGKDWLPVDSGNVLPDGTTIWVKNSAEFGFRDASMTGDQPAAEFRVNGDAKLELRDGVPHLLRGSMDVHSHRDMSVGLGDRSSVDLGAGEYVIDAVEPSALDLLLADAGHLSAAVAVHGGEAATMRRETGATREIPVGSVGSFDGAFGIAVENIPSGNSITQAAPRQPLDPPDYPDLEGKVRTVHGTAVAGARVSLSYVVGSELVHRQLTTDTQGSYRLASGSNIAPGFVVVGVEPPASSGRDLGGFAADVRRLTPMAVGYTVDDVVLLNASPLHGVVVDNLEQPVRGVRLVPVLYDELLGQIAPYAGAAAESDGNGQFAISGMPSVMPRHQRLAIVAFHADFNLAFQAVPMPGSAALYTAQLRLVLQPLRTVSLTDLPGSGYHDVYEEPLGLPPGTGLRRFRVDAGLSNSTQAVRLGLGRLWLRTASSAGVHTLRPIVFGTGAGSTFGVGTLGAESFLSSSIFRPLEDVQDTGEQLRLARESRHQAFIAAGNRTLLVEDCLGRQVADAQVFALARRQVGGTTARFLGLSGGGCGLVPSETEIVAFSNSDGSVVMAEVAALAVPVSRLQLRGTGAARFIPGVGGDRSCVMLEFRPLAVGSTGARPSLFRFACVAENWTVSGLPAGAYEVFDYRGTSWTVVVEPDQTIPIGH